MPEQPSEIMDASRSSCALARDPNLFCHLAGSEREVALQKYVADSIAKCVAPLIARERVDCANKVAAAIANEIGPLLASHKQRKKIARKMRKVMGVT